jgi:glycerate dehydrogenase
MKIVVLDGYTENPGDLSWEGQEQFGELTVYYRTSYEESPLIAQRIGDAEIVVMNKTPISRRTMAACPNIKAIAVLATGYNVVDVACAKEKGIPVMNVPVYGTYSVSQFAIALLLEVCPHIGHHSHTVHEGKWSSNPEWCLRARPTACWVWGTSACTPRPSPKRWACA